MYVKMIKLAHTKINRPGVCNFSMFVNSKAKVGNFDIKEVGKKNILRLDISDKGM